jgi:hypothetical protein
MPCLELYGFKEPGSRTDEYRSIFELLAEEIGSAATEQ